MSEILKVSGNKIRTLHINGEDYICITDIAKEKNHEFPADVIKNWMRTKFTVQYLGMWEQMNNDVFKLVEFHQFEKEAGERAFVLSPKKWIESVNAIGIVSKAGNNGGTYAHKDIAFEFASWISVEFKLYLIKEFQRLKEIEQRRLEPEWNVNRILSKVNYKIHTDAIKHSLIDGKISDKKKQGIKYASEADMLNVAVFGRTNKMWREESGISSKNKNIREYANIHELLVLSNLEYLNSLMIEQGIDEAKRFDKLCSEATKQLKNLGSNASVKKLGMEEK